MADFQVARNQIRAVLAKADASLADFSVHVAQVLRVANAPAAATIGTDLSSPLGSQLALATELKSQMQLVLSNAERLLKVCENAAGTPGDIAQVKRFSGQVSSSVSEYRILCGQLEAHMKRTRLLNAKDEGGQGPTTEQQHLLRERAAIETTLNIVEDSLEQGRSTDQRLQHQQNRTRRIADGMSTIAQKFPAIENVISRIRKAKTREHLIVASVAAACMLFIFFWIFHW
eukprot:Polyplicarium_translucidae@DN1017_c0_g1_i1.p1